MSTATSTIPTGTAPAEPFVHPALFYADTDEYLAGTVPFVRDGLAAGEPVMVAVPGDNLELIRAALGVDADRVLLHDMTVAGRNPGRIIPGVLLAFAAAHAGKPVRIIGEPIWAGRSFVEYPACAQHEALINAAFTGRSATILCPYDTVRLSPEWVRDALRTHPTVWTATARRDSAHYTDPVALAAEFNQPLPDPPAHAVTMTVERDCLAAARRFATAHAQAAAVAPERIIDVTLVVSELAANTIEHGGGRGSLAIWVEGLDLVCQVTDAGHLTDPLAGRLPVPPDQATGGRGLVLVNQLCDLVRLHTRPGSTTIRVHVRR
jgi:anti-sigma regulatory factor (Ser/Thr protein kinase)